MGVQTVQAIILRHADERERDRQVVALSETSGLLRLRARGAKAGSAKLSGSLEPLTEVALTFADGRALGVVTGAVVREKFSGLRQDVYALVGGQWLAELIERVSHPGAPASSVYGIFRSWLLETAATSGLSSGRRWLSLDRAALDILRCEGFVPAFDHCTRCSRPMPAEIVAYEPAVGFVHEDEAGNDAVRVTRSALEWLDGKMVEVGEKPLFQSVHPLVTKLIQQTLDRPLASETVLKSIFHLERLSRPAD